MSSRLTNIHTHGLVENDEFIFGYNEKPSFGLLTINTNLADPTISYQIINIDDEAIDGCNLTLSLSELSF